MKIKGLNLLRNLLIINIVIFIHSNIYSQSNLYKVQEQKIIMSLGQIYNRYVDTVNVESIVEAGIIAMLKELDPHSVYLSAEELKKANEPLEGSFTGIGVEFNIMKDTIMVISAITGGPSEKLGILPGDKIVKIDGEDATGKKVTNSYVMKKLRGPKGTKVVVSIYRKGYKNLIDFEIIRDKIPIYSIDASYMAAPRVGYIKLSRFAESSIEEFDKALTELKNKGMENLILDLRYNSGGYLNIAVSLADEFLSDNKMIVYTEGKSSPRTNYMATKKGNFEKGKLVVLINEGSASASEIVAGAIQDWDRGILIGRRSFGKGLVQTPIRLNDGSAIRLTTARYYTPTGRFIQKPYNEGVDQYNTELDKRYKKGELIHPDSIHFPDSLKYLTAGKRTVYGGGGIMPDIFIPLDTSGNSKYFTDLIRKSIIYQFALNYVNNNRDSLLALYRNVDNYIKTCQPDDNFMKQFFIYSESNGVSKDIEGYKSSEKYIITQLKSYIARHLWDNSSFYQVFNTTDEGFLKALEVIQDNSLFKKLKIEYK